jgi:amino acid transporter
VIYVLFAYIATIGWGPDRMGDYAANPAPWDVMGTQYWNSTATILVDLAAAIAALAGGMASQNGAARMLYALGRERLLPASFGHTNRRFGTPDVALTTLLVAAVAIGLGLGFAYDPISAFALLGLVVTFSALGVYFIAQLACIFFFSQRRMLHWFWHVVVPVGAMAVIGYLFYETVTPKQPHPLNLGIWIAVAWGIAGVVVTAAMSAAAPHRFARLSQILGVDEPGELLAEEGVSTPAPQE